MYKNGNAENVKIYENYFIKIWKFENMKIQKWKIIICGCWPPSGPPAAKNQVFLIFMWMLAPSKASGGKKSSIFFDFYIAFKRFLTCGNDRSRQIIAKSGFKSEKLALCVELWPKHSQKRNLVPMLYIELFSNPYLSFFWAFSVGTTYLKNKD